MFRRRRTAVLLSLTIVSAAGGSPPAAGSARHRARHAHRTTRVHRPKRAAVRKRRTPRPTAPTLSATPLLAPVSLLDPPASWLPAPAIAPLPAAATATGQTPAAPPAPMPTTPPQAAPTVAGPAPDTAPTPSLAAPPTAPNRLFAASSFWNAPLADDAPTDPKSSAYVAKLLQLRAKYTTWINTTANSVPVYRVAADQPLVKVTLDKNAIDPSSKALAAAFAAGVPIPANAVAGAGVDHNLVVYQPSTDTYWELWVAQKLADGWHARWGGKLTDVSSSEGRYTDPNPLWGSSATSLPLIGGLMTLDELRQGRIDHALAISLPEARAHVHAWPAQRTDGTVDDPDAIPEGTRLRIDPKVNLALIPMAPLTRMMAEAAQRYGIVVRDTSGAIAFYGEDPTPTGTHPYGTIFGGAYPSALLAQFPWDKLQALETQLAVDRS